MSNVFQQFFQKVAEVCGEAPNPVDEAIESQQTTKEKVAAKRRADEHAAWEQWQQDPTHGNLHQLMKKFEPVFKRKVQQWKAPNVPEAAFKANLKVHAMDAFQSFDPNRGAQLKTHLEHRLKKAQRFNVQHQNYAYIPEEKAGRIGDINRAQDELSEQLGRQPNPMEIANWLNPQLSKRQQLTPKKVEAIQQAQFGDVIGSSFESDPTPRTVAREREVLGLLRPTLTQDQQAVFDHIYGQGGKKKITSTSELAKALGKSPSQISRLRTGILKKFEHYK